MTEKLCPEHARILVQNPNQSLKKDPSLNSNQKNAVCCTPKVGSRTEQVAPELTSWRRKCGCLRTSEKLKNMLGSFPNAPPPTPIPQYVAMVDKRGGYGYVSYGSFTGRVDKPYMRPMDCCTWGDKRAASRSWTVVAELVQLVQLSVTATALALYYIIYCYMQLVYYTLRSALYFHNADGPMKITIGVVTVTSLIVGFNLMLRMERILGIIY